MLDISNFVKNPCPCQNHIKNVVKVSVKSDSQLQMLDTPGDIQHKVNQSVLLTLLADS